MNRRILFILAYLTPLFLSAQTYSFNRQTMIYFEDEHRSRVDTWQTPITVEVQKKIIILRRPPTEAGERTRVDTLHIKSNNKEHRDKKEDFTKFKITDGRILVIYSDQYITMCTKETKDHKRTEYVFYNQTINY